MKKTGWIVAALVLGVAGAVGYSQWQNRARGLPDGLIQANGRLEGDSVLIAGKYPLLIS